MNFLLKRLSLRFLLTFAFLLPLPIIAVVTTMGAKKSVEEKANFYSSSALSLADMIDAKIAERSKDLAAFAKISAPWLTSQEDEYYPSNSSIVDAMNGFVEAYDSYYFTLLVGTDGKLIAVNNKDQAGNAIDTQALYDAEFSNADWFAKCLAGDSDTVVEDLHVDEFATSAYGDEGLAIGFSKAVRDDNGSVIGVWKNVTKFELVENQLLQAYLKLKAQENPSAEITLLDSVGHVIIDCDPTKIGKEAIVRDLSVIGKFNLADKGVAAAVNVVNGESGGLTKSWHARKKIDQVAGYSPTKGLFTWNVLVRVPCTEAYAATNRAQSVVTKTLAGMAIAMVIIAVLFSYGLSSELKQAVTAMEAAQSGDYSQTCSGRLSRDIARLSTALHNMLDALATAEIRDADYRGQIEAISNNSAVIEFEPSGKVIKANENFLNALGYQLSEIQGQHHRLFCPPDVTQSSDYETHWDKLRSGQSVSGDFKRVTKTGSTIWIRASYNPICGIDGTVQKVVKYADDITAAKQLEEQVAKTRELEQGKVEQLLEIVDRISDGDISRDIPELGNESIGRIASGFQKAMTAIRSALLQVQDVSSTVATAANEMTGAADEISRGAQQQAARLEETAASLEEITVTVKQNSDNAQEARALATSSSNIATEGGDVVSNAVQAMQDINDSSMKISDIITTIDEIAFQTNLLALNAAVEAARAGEQGRGFAVVASEVRNLAQRSASSAKEIKNLIQDSNSKVARGSELVNKSGQTLGEIVDSVRRVTEIVSDIASASQEQLISIQQVNPAVTQMDHLTQSNANQTEEMAGTSASVLEHAKQLEERVSRFQLGDGTSDEGAYSGDYEDEYSEFTEELCF